MKRKKSRKLRGNRKQGFGKEHRGKGQKGGSGRAGSGKSSCAKKPNFWFAPLGRVGFKPKGVFALENPIDFKSIAQKLEGWIKEGKVKIENDVPIIDLVALGYNKLLATGKAFKSIITVNNFSPRALKKLEKVGGKIVKLNSMVS